MNNSYDSSEYSNNLSVFKSDLDHKKQRKRRKFDQLDRNVICPIKDCNRKYASTHSLQQHMKIKHQKSVVYVKNGLPKYATPITFDYQSFEEKSNTFPNSSNNLPDLFNSNEDSLRKDLGESFDTSFLKKFNNSLNKENNFVPNNIYCGTDSSNSSFIRNNQYNSNILNNKNPSSNFYRHYSLISQNFSSLDFNEKSSSYTQNLNNELNYNQLEPYADDLKSDMNPNIDFELGFDFTNKESPDHLNLNDFYENPELFDFD